MTLAERLTRKVTLEIGPRSTIRVLFTHAALIDLEEMTGLSAVSGEFDFWAPPARLIRDAILVLAQHQGLDVQPAEIARAVGFTGLGRACERLREGWIASMARKEAAPRSSKPQKKAEPLTWPELWAEQRANLGMSDQEWLAITPRLAQELSKANLEKTRRRELLLSRIGATIANFSMHPPKEPLRDDAHMVHPWERDKEQLDEPESILRSLLPFVNEESKGAIREVVESGN